MHERAGLQAKPEDLVNLDELLDAFYSVDPNPNNAGQRVSFGTSGHRGSSLNGSFNARHITVICEAIAQYRKEAGITGPLFIGADTHPLSAVALDVAVETLLANGVRVLGSLDNEFVPTPALSHAILEHNGANTSELADGIIITPSHNPPADGGIKYNPPHGGPAETEITAKIADLANELLAAKNETPNSENADPRVVAEPYDFLTNYVKNLDQIVDMRAIAESGLKIACHPLGGASYAYWQEINRQWGLNLDILGPKHDPQWSFMTLDWDGQIRMDPSSADAMRVATDLQETYDLVLANDADADRFGIVTRDAGLIAPNDFLAVASDHLLRTRILGKNPFNGERANGSEDIKGSHRADIKNVQIGKTLVSSAMIDRVVGSHEKQIYETPVGFKWFVSGLHDGSLLFAGEESAGASFLRFDGTPWSTDKDGIIMCLLAAEITAKTAQTVHENYVELQNRFGESNYKRIDAKATPAQKAKLVKLQANDIQETQLAGEDITQVLVQAKSNAEPIGGIKVVTENAWFAARPSGTEDVYKIYAESFIDQQHLDLVIAQAQEIVQRALTK